VIQVGTGMDKEAKKTSGYNQNIVIEDNLFRVFDSTPLLKYLCGGWPEIP
jgi:hypothetical protein